MTDDEIGPATRYRLNAANDALRPHGLEIRGVVRDDKDRKRKWIVALIGSDRSLCTPYGLDLKAAIAFADKWVNK
jgi:hypothetical protein